MSFMMTHLVGFGGGGVWTPALLTTSAWYDPSDMSTMWTDTGGTTPVTADGDLVARIDDKSGNGRNATQATSGARPTFKTSAGKNWLDFDGGDSLVTSAFTHPQLWTCAAGCYLTNLTGVRHVACADNSTTSRHAQYMRTNGTTHEAITFNSLNTPFTDAGSTLSTSTGYTLIDVRNTSTIEAYANNASGGSTATTGTAKSGVSLALTIGSPSSGLADSPMIGRVYGLVLVPSVVSADDRGNLHAYLAEKVGI